MFQINFVFKYWFYFVVQMSCLICAFFTLKGNHFDDLLSESTAFFLANCCKVIVIIFLDSWSKWSSGLSTIIYSGFCLIQ
jgi:hypothetical protein